MMKNVKNFKKKKKIEKNTIYAYILLAFFLFWTIGSIFGFIAFGKQKKESNVVSASANVVEDFISGGAINNMNAFQNGVYVTEDGNNVSCYYDSIYEEFVIDIDLVDKSAYNNQQGELFSLEWLCDEELVNGKRYIISFVIDSPDIAFINLPIFQLRSFDSSDNLIDYENFYIQQADFGLPARYTFELWYDDALTYYIYMYCPPAFNLQYRDFLYIFSPTFVNYYVTIGNYVYTYQELHDIYEYELYQSYLAGASSNTLFQDGYDEGYYDALTSVNNSIYHFFGANHIDMTFVLSTGDYTTTLRQRPTPIFDIYDFAQEGFSNLGISLADASNGYYHLTFTDFPSDLILLPTYEFIGYCELIFSDLAPVPFTDITITTNKGSYVSSRSWQSGEKYKYIIELGNIEEDEYLISVDIVGYGNYINQHPVLQGYDYRYVLGFDFAYAEAYDYFVLNYGAFLDEKYQEGVRYGQQVGYNDGYNAGVEDSNEYTFTGLLSAVVDVPIRAFTSLFNFEILGINLANFFFALLTICLVLAIIKLVI